jgi:DNA-binding PadR family transcriptional regulator
VRVPLPDDLILGLLISRPQHGYELLAHFEKPSELGRVWTMSRSQVYAVLKRLESQSMLRGRAVRGQDAPDRVEYKVTAAGRRKLETWLTEAEPSASVRSIRVNFISRLYVAEQLDRPLGPIIDRQTAVCLDRLAILEAARGAAASVTERRSLDFVIGQLKAAIAWLDELPTLVPSTQEAAGASRGGDMGALRPFG